MLFRDWRRKRRPDRRVQYGIALLVLCFILLAIALSLLFRQSQDAHPTPGDVRAFESAQQSAVPSAPADTQAVGSPNPSSRPDTRTSDEPPAPRMPILEDVGGYPVIARLVIEKLSLELAVIERCSDAALEVSVCLYAGPSSPEYDGNMVIIGHNYSDDSDFGRLDELKGGDVIMLMDKYGGEHRYEVYDAETIRPDQISALEIYEGDRALSLITCTENGKNRLLVRCRRME